MNLKLKEWIAKITDYIGVTKSTHINVTHSGTAIGAAYFYKRGGVVEMWFRQNPGKAFPRNQWVTLFKIPEGFRPYYGGFDRAVLDNGASTVAKALSFMRVDSSFNVMVYIYSDSPTTNLIYFDELYLGGVLLNSIFKAFRHREEVAA